MKSISITVDEITMAATTPDVAPGKKFIWFNANSHRHENNKYNMHFDQAVQLVILSDKEYTRLTDRLYFHILFLHC